eukprot:m.243933 g.243933  ORF g.243933 m.243933 type:complete len:155 (+) comp15838_c0_seq1:973-1437(+)
MAVYGRARGRTMSRFVGSLQEIPSETAALGLCALPSHHCVLHPFNRYFQGNTEVPMLIFENVAGESEQVDWEGTIPNDGDVEAAVRAVGFEPLPVKKGDLVAIHGQVDHLSLPNTSAKSRHTFQLHLIEGPTEGIKWSNRNWLQYPEGRSFPKL